MSAKWLGILTLVMSMAAESIAQVALKVGASGGPRVFSAPFDQWANKQRMTSTPTSWIVIGVIFYAIQIFLWTYVLHLLDLAIAFPMASLCFVGVALLSKFLLAERVGTLRWLGVLCILAGTIFLAL